MKPLVAVQSPVIPVKTGIQWGRPLSWIPTFVGMTISNYVTTKLFVSCLVIAGMLISSQEIFAQPKDTPDSIRFAALGSLYRSIQSVNKRNMRLQGLQKEFEEMQPLAPQNLDSVHLEANLAQVRKYLLFLNNHRNELKKNLSVVNDSLKMFEAKMNKDEEKKAIEDFLEAYREESAAFTGYSQRLSLMLTQVRNALMFLQTVPMTINGNDVTFNTDKSANEKYMDYESTISNGQIEVDKAIERTVKLTEKENKAIQEAADALNK